MTTTSERVAEGVAFLDEKFPGWLDKVDLSRLNMSIGGECILSQVTQRADWYSAMQVARIDASTARDLGFNTRDEDYHALETEWRWWVESRRRAGSTRVTETVAATPPSLLASLTFNGDLVAHVTWDTLPALLKHFGPGTYEIKECR